MTPAALAMPAQEMGDDLMAMGSEFAPPEPDYKVASLKDLVAWLEDAEEATDSSRALSERDRDYYDHKQLTADQIRVLRKRRQPEIVIPRIQAKVNFLLGYEASQRTDPRGFPRTPDDEEAADACTDALRYTKDVTGLDMSASQVWENMLVEGFGGLEALVETELDGDADVEIKRHQLSKNCRGSAACEGVNARISAVTTSSATKGSAFTRLCRSASDVLFATIAPPS